MEKISHYCQKCRAANEPGETHCWRCGTTLMLVVYPPSIQHEELIIPSYYEDHLLERVSLLELRLSQMTEKMSLALDLMLKQAKTIQADHALLKSILEILDSYGIAETGGISAAENSGSADDQPVKSDASDRTEKLDAIIGRHDAPNSELFTHLVEESVKLLERNEEKQAFQMLDRAALLSPENVSLFLFIAEHLFRAEKYAEARERLEKAYSIEPHNPGVLLLFGALNADEGETEKARRLLSALANDRKTEAVVNYIWGMLAAFEENWTEALAAFKTSHASRETPEIEYLIACCYFQMQLTDKAKHYFRAATEKDDNFADAWFMSGLTEPNSQFAEHALEKAQNAKDAGAQCLEFIKGKKAYALETVMPFAHFRNDRPKLLTKGSLRLVRAFKTGVLDALG